MTRAEWRRGAVIYRIQALSLIYSNADNGAAVMHSQLAMWVPSGDSQRCGSLRPPASPLDPSKDASDRHGPASSAPNPAAPRRRDRDCLAGTG